MGVLYAIAPESGVAGYLTAGRAYRVLREDDNGEGFCIENDVGGESYCLWRLCAHLRTPTGCGSWTREERSEAPEGEAQ